LVGHNPNGDRYEIDAVLSNNSQAVEEKMSISNRSKITFVAILFTFLSFNLPLAAQQTGPRLFFTDLESGPNTGGEQNLGAFITIYGEGFGSSRGSSIVTIGGREVARYVLWGQDNAPRSLDMIVVQPGPNAVTGNIIVTVNGAASNPLPFTIRSGNIYFVATSGSDSNPGSFEQPWRTIVKAKDTIAAGDIAYMRDGVTATAEENYSAALSIETGGSQGAPKALVAYPGATATIGSTNLEFGMRVPNNPNTIANDWVFAKLVLRGQIEAVEIGGDGSSRWRVVGNDISCPVGDGQTGCFTASLASNISFFGNEVHGVSKQGPQPSKQYHAVYFTTDTNHVEVGWNYIHDNNTCRAIQFHSSPLMEGTGYNQYDLSVHDNLIHGDVCDGIVFATVDPSKGAVRAFNNVIYDVGLGPDPPDGSANYSGIYVAGTTNTGPDGKGDVEILNNTLYNCGGRKLLQETIGDEGAFSRGPGSPSLFMSLKNNIVYAVQGEDYISPSSDTTVISGNHNLWFGSGAPPSFLSSNIAADPKFVNLGSRDFRLQAQSPAIDAGANTGILRDYSGISRPQGSAYDIGAHEYAQQQVALRKDDILGTWNGGGIYYRNSDSGAWNYLSSAASQITAGDFDGDGIGDLVGVWQGSGTWVRYSSTGGWVILSSVADWIAAGDLNGDGRADLVGIWGGEIWSRDTGTGAWSHISSEARVIAAGDLDGDGKSDLIAVWPDSGTWVRYTSTGQWANLTSAAEWVAAADFNGDGRADLLGIWKSQAYLRDSATGAWTLLSSGASQVMGGDIDGDCKVDLVGLWPGSGVWVKYSSTGAWQKVSSPADWIAVGRMR
jgi:hypothetical protein